MASPYNCPAANRILSLLGMLLLVPLLREKAVAFAIPDGVTYAHADADVDVDADCDPKVATELPVSVDLFP